MASNKMRCNNVAGVRYLWVTSINSDFLILLFFISGSYFSFRNFAKLSFITKLIRFFSNSTSIIFSSMDLLIVLFSMFLQCYLPVSSLFTHYLNCSSLYHRHHRPILAANLNLIFYAYLFSVMTLFSWILPILY